MVTEVNRSIMHPVHIVQGGSNAPCAYSSIVQRFSLSTMVWQQIQLVVHQDSWLLPANN